NGRRLGHASGFRVAGTAELAVRSPFSGGSQSRVGGVTDSKGSRVVERDGAGAIAHLIQEFGKLPGIGPKTAERLTHHLLGSGRGQAVALAEALRGISERIRPCRQCFNLTEGDLCSICSDARRDAALLCVV